MSKISLDAESDLADSLTHYLLELLKVPGLHASMPPSPRLIGPLLQYLLLQGLPHGRQAHASLFCTLPPPPVGEGLTFRLAGGARLRG
jgi:hypothetical protein